MASSMINEQSSAVASAFKLCPVLESSKSGIGFGRGLYDLSQVNTGVHPVDQTPAQERIVVATEYRLSLSNSEKRTLPSLSESPKPLPEVRTPLHQPLKFCNEVVGLTVKKSPWKLIKV